MSRKVRLRTWPGPLAIRSFVVMVVPGVVLFFYLSFGAVKLAHQWLGWPYLSSSFLSSPTIYAPPPP